MPPNPHILHVVESLRTGGAERLVHDLVIARGPDSTSVACLDAVGPFGEALRSRGFTVELIGKENGFVSTLSRMRKYLRRTQPAVVHCHNLPAFLYGALAARLAGDIPVVLTKHGVRLPTGLKARLSRLLIRRSEVVGVSPEARDIIQAWMSRDTPPVLYIANGISMEPFGSAPSREEARTQLGLPVSPFIVGIVSRVMPCKNHLELIDVFARILVKFPSALLLIVGDGKMLPAVTARVQERGLEKSVLLLGERHDVPAILAAMDVFCLPSDMEGMPMTILEAMAAALPVVTTNVGGIPECVTEGVTGLMVQPHSPDSLEAALLTLAANPERARDMGLAGRLRFLKKFSVAHAIDAYEECYREVLNRRPASRHWIHSRPQSAHK